MNKCSRRLRFFWVDENAVTSIEYALLGALIAVVIVATITEVGMNVQALFQNVADQVEVVVASVI